MPLHFTHTREINRTTRGLTADALESFHTAFIGDIEFGHYFLISRPGDAEVWRWTVQFPVTGETAGMGSSEQESRAKLEALYNQLLAATSLRSASRPRRSHFRTA